MTVEMPNGMPAGSVVITPSQMYAEIRVMGGKVDHLASVIDPALTNIREDIIAIQAKAHEDAATARALAETLDLRVQGLTSRVDRLKGVGIAVTFVLSSAVTIIAALINRGVIH